MPEQHELIYIATTRSGAAIWQCPRCEHRMLTRSQPTFEAELLREGDPGVAHSGNLGAVKTQVLRGPAAVLTEGEQAWLDNAGIDWDADGADWDKPAA